MFFFFPFVVMIVVVCCMIAVIVLHSPVCVKSFQDSDGFTQAKVFYVFEETPKWLVEYYDEFGSACIKKSYYTFKHACRAAQLKNEPN